MVHRLKDVDGVSAVFLHDDFIDNRISILCPGNRDQTIVIGGVVVDFDKVGQGNATRRQVKRIQRVGETCIRCETEILHAVRSSVNNIGQVARGGHIFCFTIAIGSAAVRQSILPKVNGIG